MFFSTTDKVTSPQSRPDQLYKRESVESLLWTQICDCCMTGVRIWPIPMKAKVASVYAKSKSAPTEKVKAMVPKP